MTDLDRREKAALIADAALDRKAEKLVALDVREIASFADTIVIATGNSNRHAKAIADAIGKALSARGEKPQGVEGYDEGRWILMDFTDVIVHVFQPEVREHYDLERIWSDAPSLELPSVSSGAVS